MTIYVTIEATRTEPVLSHVVDVVRCVLFNGLWYVRYNGTSYKIPSEGDSIVSILRQIDSIAATELGPAWYVETFQISKDEWLAGIEQAYGLI
jgi:hypothetical protein